MQPKNNWASLHRPADPEGSAGWPGALAADLTAEWEVGRPVLVEAYLQHLGDLGDDPKAVGALVAAEHEVRGRFGVDLPDAVYEARLRSWFPNPAYPVTPDRGESPAPAPGPALPGRVAGRYTPVASLGPRRTGQALGVYLARDEWLGRHVTLKVSQREEGGAEDPVGRELRADVSFQREARYGATLEHPHFVKVLDVGVDGAQRYLAMEYVPGPPLAVYTDRARLLDPLLVVRLVRVLADALDDLHARGAWHRDLKPDNILFHADGRVVVVDLGGIGEGDDGGGPWTPGYEAPEGQTHPRADIFSLGVILFQLLTGAPFPFGNPANKAERDIRVLAEFNPYAPEYEVDPALVQVGRRCFAGADLEFGRYASMREFSRALAGYEQGVFDGVAAAGRRRAARRRRARVGLTAVAAAVLLGASAGGGWWAAGRWRPAPPEAPRVAVGPRAVSRAMVRHLEPLADELRRDTRFLSLDHRHNDPEVTAADLAGDRAALADLLAGLTGGPAGEALRPVDAGQTVFAVSLSDLGWDAWKWGRLCDACPYKVVPAVSGELLKQGETWTASEQVVLRADWLIHFLSAHPDRAFFLRPGRGPMPEGVGAAGRRFALGPITLGRAAAELGLPYPDALEKAILDGKLPACLGPLAGHKTIPRRVWETPCEGGLSPFHQAVNVLDLGTVR